MSCVNIINTKSGKFKFLGCIRRPGFTLVEVLIITAILSFILGAVLIVMNTGNMSWHQETDLVVLQQRVRFSMEGMTREIRQTNKVLNRGNLTVVSSSEITFSLPPAVYDDLWIGPIRYYLDTQNNRIMREYPAGTEMILADNIDSLVFSSVGDTVTINIVGQKTTARGRVLTLSLDKKVRLRNE